MRKLAACPRGQVTTEYAGVAAVLIATILGAWYLMASPLKQGFMDLAQRIIDMNP